MTDRIVAPAGCSTCAGECCRVYRVEVSARDIRDMAAAIPVHPREYVVLWDSGQTRGFRLVKDGPLCSLYLQREVNSEGRPGRCAFLMEIAPGHARCGIYTHRPLVCSHFPASLKPPTVDIRRESQCGPGAWNILSIDLPARRRTMMDLRGAWLEMDEMAEVWNKRIDEGFGAMRGVTKDHLLDFLLTYDNTLRGTG